MLRKFVLLAIALLSGLPTLTAGDLYLVGPGTPTGWDLDNPIKLNCINEEDQTFVTVCYLFNADGGSSFRFQPSKEFLETPNYYGPSTANAAVANYETIELTENTDNCFSVKYPGSYYIEVSLNKKYVKLNRMGQMFVANRTAFNDNWTVNNETPLTLYSESPDIYWGKVNLADGEFKIALDPKDDNLNDDRFFLFKGAGKTSFVSSSGSNWKIGNPVEKDNEVNDLVAGTYNIKVDAAEQVIKFYMHADNAHLIGPAVSSWDYDDKYPRLTSIEDGKFVQKHVFFRSGELFKVVVDGKYYGADSWEQTTLGDYSTQYLRAIGNGADLMVDESGFREVTVGPSDSGDGTLYINLSGLQAVWYTGICSLDYDAESDSYINKNGLSWLSAGLTSEVNINGDVVSTLTADNTGWYKASVTFDGNIPSYNLEWLEPSIEGNALSETLRFEEYEAADNKFVRKHTYLSAGTLVGRIGGYASAETEVAKAGYYTITLYMGEENQPQIRLDGPFEVHMPLTEEDFNDGRKHYFLVGQRMGAWRLQPEWEFIPKTDGTYAIPARLLYNGYVMVGEVDNYEDYITQTYHGYSHTDISAISNVDLPEGDQDVTRELPLAILPAVGKNGCADGKYTATRYNDINLTSPDKQHGGWDAMKTRLLNILTPDGFSDVAHIQSAPTRVNEIILTVDEDGHPSYVKFDGLNTSASEVAKLRTFSLVGGGIKNTTVTYDKNGVTSPLNHQEGYNGAEWSEAWIQYDNSARPYVDGNGEYIYQTSFTRNWLDAHPCYFNFGKDFEYTSTNITFNYAPELTHADQFGQREVTNDNNFTQKEVIYTYFRTPGEGELIGRNDLAAQDLDDMLTIPAEDRACFVVEDMWMEGMFKVWSGWGGSATNYEFEDNGTNYTRWYRSNAGHGRIGEDCTAFYSANQIMGFTLFEDMSAANFGIGYGVPSTAGNTNPKVDENGVIRDEYKGQHERRFFKRVEIWFNLKNGFAYKGKENASILLFYQEKGGPNITIAKADESHINYNFNIPLINNMPEETDQVEFGNVVKYAIYRIEIDDEGHEGEPILVETVEKGENSPLGPDGTPRKDFGNIDIQDPAILPAGRYRYMIETTRANSPEVMTAKSNIVRLDPQTLPNSGIENICHGENSLFSLKASAVAGEGRLKVNANDEIGWLTIYTINGSIVNRLHITANAASIDISALAAGVYIINANNKSVRFIKR